MAERLLVEALTVYGKSWMIRSSPKADLVWQRYMYEPSRSRRDVVYQLSYKGDFSKTDLFLSQSHIYTAPLAPHEFSEAQIPLAGMVWASPVPGQQVEMLRNRAGRPPTMPWLEQHLVKYIKIPPNWGFSEEKEGPLAAYEGFIAAASRGVREPLLVTGLSSLSLDEETDDGISGPRLELADFGQLIPSVRPAEETQEDDWAIVRSDRTDVELRCQSLQALIFSEEESAAQFIVNELCRSDLSRSWRDCLILCAENAQFSGESLRTALRKRLFELAIALRQSGEAEARPIILSAIRSYASLLAQSDAVSLLAFLEPPNLIETRLVTLQCIVHLFQSSSPQSACVLRSLSDRVYELADKFLDRDWLVPGEKAAIGEIATSALAALGDERLRSCIERIKSLGLPWLRRQVARKLEVTLREWRSGGNQLPGVYEFVRDQLSALSE